MTWSLAVLLVAPLAVFGWIRRRHRGEVDSGGPSSELPPQVRSDHPARGLPATNAELAETPATSCPVCHSEFPASSRFCVRDGAPLADGRASGPFSPGMICPTCRRGYPADASFCPEDADELVPYGLYGAANATRPPQRMDAGKICPECGVRHQAAHLFCGHDGAELVVVN